MESVATEILQLVRLAGLSPDDALHSIRAQLTGAGTISIAVPRGQCLVVTGISAFNVDYSQPNTVAIGKQGQPGIAQQLQLVIESPCLYVFGQTVKATLTFVYTAQPWAADALAEVRGYFLPASALAALGKVATLKI